MHNRRYHHGDLRAALLDGARQVLRERGADALSLRELAREIGVSHAAPSRHFKDKRALLDALAVDGFERLNEALQKALQNVPATGSDYNAKLRAVGRAYVDFAVEEAALLAVMYAGKHAPDVSPELQAASAKLGAAALPLILDGQRDGHVRQGDVGRIALVFFAGIHGFASLRAGGVLPDGDYDQVLDDLVDDLARAIAP